MPPDASVRGIIVDDYCSHKCLSGCGLLTWHGLKIERFVESTKTEGESLLEHPLAYPISDLQLSCCANGALDTLQMHGRRYHIVQL
jgi:hypothetical protein